MLKIIYDPYEGQTMPDARVPEFVDTVLAARPKLVDIGSNLILDEFRLRIVKGELDPNDVIFVYAGEEFRLTAYGNPGVDGHWPRGMFNYSDEVVSRIITAQAARHKKEKAVKDSLTS